jgi:hypothetical protein
LTEYSDLSEAETEEMETMETAVVVMIEMAVVVMAQMAVVMTMAEKAAADGNDGEGGNRWHIRGDTGS